MTETNTQPEKQVHKGNIEYTLTQENGEWSIEFESTIENDIAALSIAQYLSENIVAGLSIEKKQLTSVKQKRHLSAIITKGAAARFGLKLMIDYMQPLSYEFQAR